MDHISHLINDGHIDFGENKVQEVDKWTNVKEITKSKFTYDRKITN